MLNKTPFLAVAALFLAVALPAQTAYKYGHMNFGNLVEQMPDVKAAEAKLKVFADKLAATDDSLTKSFQADYEKLAKAYQAGELTPLVAQQQQAELEKRQQAIQAFEEDANKQVTDRRNELLKPILDKVQEAVNQVAKANGYAMVFDTSTGAALYALETEDITPLVKKQLGMQ
jgi:outer membrane protein